MVKDQRKERTMVSTYKEWQEALYRAYKAMNDIGDQYLNEDGKERMSTYYRLYDMSLWADTAEELLELIADPKFGDQHDRKALESHHAELPLCRLRKIAENTKGENIA
jgi:hypothetical protein